MKRPRLSHVRRPRLSMEGASPREDAEGSPYGDGCVWELALPEALHGARVLRLRPGDPVEILGAVGAAPAEVVRASGTPPRLAVRFTGPFAVTPFPPPPAVLGLAAVRPRAFEWAAEKASELGCALLVPLLTARSRAAGHEAGFGIVRRAKLAARESRKQCGRDSEMEVSDPLAFGAFLEALPRLLDPDGDSARGLAGDGFAGGVAGDGLREDAGGCVPEGPHPDPDGDSARGLAGDGFAGGLAGDGLREDAGGCVPKGPHPSGSCGPGASGPGSGGPGLRLLADREGAPILKALGSLAGAPGGADAPDPPRPAVVVGPEGGLAPRERAAALAAGFVPVSLGPYALKSETAAAAALAALSAFCLAGR